MSENVSEVVKQAGSKKSTPARLKMIRIIGGPEITPPPGSDFQQVPFTIRGLSRIEGLHRADTVIVWPSLSILDSKEFTDMLAECAGMLDRVNAPPTLLGLPCKVAECDINDAAMRKAMNEGYITYGPVIKKALHEMLPARDCTRAFRFVVDDNDPKPMSMCARMLQERIAFAYAHQESVKNNDWSGYTNTHEKGSIESDICNLVYSALRLSILAAHNGAAVAVIFPNEFTPPDHIRNLMTSRLPHIYESLSNSPSVYSTLNDAAAKHVGHADKMQFLARVYRAGGHHKTPNQPISAEDYDAARPYLFIDNHFWLSVLIRATWMGNGSMTVHNVTTKDCPDHFMRAAAMWSNVQGHPKRTFCIERYSLHNTFSITTEGIVHDTEFFGHAPRTHLPFLSVGRTSGAGAPGAYSTGNGHEVSSKSNNNDVMVQYGPSRVDSEGHALNLVFRYGSGGFVAMSEPPSLESMLGIQTDQIPFVRIELTNRRVSIKGQQEDGYIVEVTPSSGAKSDIPMTVSTFRRFLAFCVAAKLASSTGQSGTIDLTEMTIGKHDLIGVVDPVKQGQGHKPGQLIQEAFEDVLKSKYSFIQVSPGREKDTRRLHPDFWGIVNFDKLMKQVQKPRKSDTENEDALRKIFSVLKQP